MHATQFLAKPQDHPTGPAVVISGTERFLRQQCRATLKQLVLGDDQEESVFSGKSASLSDVLDELSLISMWGERRLVVVEEADEFISEHRAALEKYLDKPAKKSILVLDVKTWNKATRLAKGVEKTGLTLVCDQLKGKELSTWISHLAGSRFGKKISPDANELLRELVGDNLGLLEQELSKLTGALGDRALIETEDVRSLVGGWKVETTWKMIDAVRDGQLALALEYLQNLYQNGESPLKILGGINFTFRKYCEAIEWTRQGTGLEQALREAKLFPNVVRPSFAYLKRLGFVKAEKLRTRLLAVDGDLKGRSRMHERTRMELLLVELSGILSADAAT